MRKGSGCRLAAVHGDDLARHEAGVVGCEELDDIRDVINVAEAAGRDCRRHGGGALLTPGEAVQAAGGHRAGGDGVDADALGGYLERRGPGEAIHRMLAGAVERRARAAPLTEGRGKVDDAAETLSRHHAQLMLEGKEHAADVDVEDGVVGLESLGDQLPAAAGEAGVVDGDVQLAEGFDGAVDQRTDIVLDADVRPDVFGVRAQLPELGRERVAFLVAPSRDDDGRALAGERRGRRSPDAGQGPGDYYHPSAHVMPSPIGCRSGLLPAREPYVQHTGDSLSCSIT